MNVNKTNIGTVVLGIGAVVLNMIVFDILIIDFSIFAFLNNFDAYIWHLKYKAQAGHWSYQITFTMTEPALNYIILLGRLSILTSLATPFKIVITMWR